MLPHTAYRLSLPKRSICLPLFDAALLLSDAVLSVQSVLQSALYLLRNCNFLIGNCTVWTAVLHCHFCATSGPISPPKRSNCLPLLDVALPLTLLLPPVQLVLQLARYWLRNYKFYISKYTLWTATLHCYFRPHLSTKRLNCLPLFRRGSTPDPIGDTCAIGFGIGPIFVEKLRIFTHGNFSTISLRRCIWC